LSKGGRANAIKADLGTPERAMLLAKEVHLIIGERLDVLVSNAGISKGATIKDHTVADFDNLFATNVRGPFFLCAATPAHPAQRLEHHCDLFCRGSYGGWQTRFGQSFDPRLRRD